MVAKYQDAPISAQRRSSSDTTNDLVDLGWVSRLRTPFPLLQKVTFERPISLEKQDARCAWFSMPNTCGNRVTMKPKVPDFHGDEPWLHSLPVFEKLIRKTRN